MVAKFLRPLFSLQCSVGEVASISGGGVVNFPAKRIIFVIFSTTKKRNGLFALKCGVVDLLTNIDAEEEKKKICQDSEIYQS